jgi:hypothetical protein
MIMMALIMLAAQLSDFYGPRCSARCNLCDPILQRTPPALNDSQRFAKPEITRQPETASRRVAEAWPGRSLGLVV